MVGASSNPSTPPSRSGRVSRAWWGIAALVVGVALMAAERCSVQDRSEIDDDLGGSSAPSFP